MTEHGLRIGIIGEEGALRQWQIKCLQALLEVPGVTLVFFMETADPRNGEKTSMLYRRWLAGHASIKAMQVVGSSNQLNGIPRIPLQNGSTSPDLEKLRGYRPDVLLQFSAYELPQSLQQLPRFGTWRFVHGERLLNVDEIPGLRERIQDQSQVTATLQRSPSGQENGRVLRNGSFGMSGRSIDEIAEIVLQGSASWPAQVSRAFLSGDAEAIRGTGSGAMDLPAPAPTNAEMLQLWWKELMGSGRVKSSSQRELEEWNFGVLPQPITSLLEERPSLNVRWLPPPGSGRWRSAPFGCMKDGQLSVLYEKYDREEEKAVIGRLRPKRDNNLKRSRDLLKEGGHLSYPFILEHEGEVYVIPEDATSAQVTLYTLNDEQTALTPVRTLLNEALFSPTVFQHDGRWWLFGTKAPIENTDLHAYHAEQLEGPYIPHLLNPIKTDIRSARPGGTPFRRGEELWRPAQDHSVPGTVRIAFNRITQLSPDRFAEETVKFFEPLKAPWSKGIRTLSSVGDITLVDGMRHTTSKVARKAGQERTVQKSRNSEHDDLNVL